MHLVVRVVPVVEVLGRVIEIVSCILEIKTEDYGVAEGSHVAWVSFLCWYICLVVTQDFFYPYISKVISLFIVILISTPISIGI